MYFVILKIIILTSYLLLIIITKINIDINIYIYLNVWYDKYL